MIKANLGSKHYQRRDDQGILQPVTDLGSYDCGEWHTECVGVSVIMRGGEAMLWCPQCRVFANLEAVSPKIDHKLGSKGKPLNWRGV